MKYNYAVKEAIFLSLKLAHFLCANMTHLHYKLRHTLCQNGTYNVLLRVLTSCAEIAHWMHTKWHTEYMPYANLLCITRWVMCCLWHIKVIGIIPSSQSYLLWRLLVFPSSLPDLTGLLPFLNRQRRDSFHEDFGKSFHTKQLIMLL